VSWQLPSLSLPISACLPPFITNDPVHGDMLTELRYSNHFQQLPSFLKPISTSDIYLISRYVEMGIFWNFKRHSHCAHRTMTYDVAVIEHIDLTALFTYRTMSNVAATTMTQKLNLVQFLRQLLHDVVRCPTTPARLGNLHVKVVGQHRPTSFSVAVSPSVVRRCRPTSSNVARCRVQCEHHFRQVTKLEKKNY